MKVPATFALLGALACTPAFAAQAQDHGAHHAPATLTEGEVRKVDRDAKKVTLRHGPIVNLDMPGMTMVFQVADPTMLDRLRTGDKVRFAADKKDGAYVVTKIEAAK